MISKMAIMTKIVAIFRGIKYHAVDSPFHDSKNVNDSSVLIAYNILYLLKDCSSCAIKTSESTQYSQVIVSNNNF